MKQNKKDKICFVISIAGFFFKFFFCYEVIAKQKRKKGAANNYCTLPKHNPKLNTKHSDPRDFDSRHALSLNKPLN